MIADWMTSTVTIASTAGVDAYGKVTLGPTRTIKARIETVQTVVRNSRGELTSYSVRVWSLDPLQPTDRLWLPGDSLTEAGRTPGNYKAIPDKSGGRVLYRVDV